VAGRWATCTDLARGLSGWTTLCVLDMKRAWRSVDIVTGAATTVNIATTSPLSVKIRRTVRVTFNYCLVALSETRHNPPMQCCKLPMRTIDLRFDLQKVLSCYVLVENLRKTYKLSAIVVIFGKC